MSGDVGHGEFPPVDPLMAAYARAGGQPVVPPVVPAGSYVDPSWPPPRPSWPPPAGALLGAARPAGEYDPFRGAWTPPPPRWSRRTRAVVIAVVAGVTALVVALAAVVAVTFAERVRDTSRQQAQATAALDAALPGLEAFVAHDTGRPWRSTVTAKVLGDADFLRTLDDSQGDDPQQPASDEDDTGVTVTAMGLAADPHDYWDASYSGVDDNVTGFYDDTTKTLYVRGSTWSPPVEDTLVHELTHANQDQSFDLAALTGATTTTDETPDVLQAVVEGEATMVEKDYYDTQSPSWQQAVDADSESGSPSDIAAVDAQGAFPYVVGESFMEGLRRQGGTAAVDKAFTHPPTHSRDLADAAGWLAGTLPAVKAVPQPALKNTTSSDVADIGVLGARGLWIAVAGVEAPQHPSVADLSTMAGWTGDTYVATDRSYDDKADTYTGPFCFVDDMTFLDTAARTRALSFVDRWTSAEHVSVVLEGPDGVRFSRCSSG